MAKPRMPELITQAVECQPTKAKLPNLPQRAMIVVRIIQPILSLILFMDKELNLVLIGFIIRPPIAQANAAPIAASSPVIILLL